MRFVLSAAALIVAAATACSGTQRGNLVPVPRPDGTIGYCPSTAEDKVVQSYSANLTVKAALDTIKKVTGEGAADVKRSAERVRDVIPDFATFEATDYLMCVDYEQRRISQEVYQRWKVDLSASVRKLMEKPPAVPPPSSLPIAKNPSVKISGRWRVEYAEAAAYRLNPDSVPITVDAVGDSIKAFPAEMEITEKDARITGVARAGDRTWRIDGYIDHDALIYVYKDTLNPNSFGSAVVRMRGNPRQFTGLWNGVSPEFTPQKTGKAITPFLISGWVRWQYLGP